MYFNIVQQLVCKTMTRLHRASFLGRALLVKILLNCMVYLVQILYTIVFLHCPATGMRNGDEASPSIILAGLAFLVKMLITLYFNIVQPLVCKTVTSLHLASFGRSSSLDENGHNSWTMWYILFKFCIQMYFNIVQPLVC